MALAVICLLFGRADAEEAAYRVHQGDRIAIAILGAPDQSGEYAVNIDGTLTHPLAGDVAAVGRAVAELRADLSERLGAYLPSPALTVSIAAYAPVFVVGNIERSGEYAFRPGMTALQLIAMAGGPRREIFPLRDGGLAIISAERDYADLSLRMFGSEVAMARFRAEINSGEFGVDVRAPAIVTQADADFIIENERRLFELRREARLSEDRGLEAQGESYENEIELLEKSITLHDDELRLLVEDVDAAKTLVERGLSTPARLRDVQRTQSATLRDALDLQAALARARQGRLDVERRRNDAAAAFRSAAGDGLRVAELQIASLRLSLDAVEKTLAAYAAAPDPSSVAASPPELELSVLRSGDDGLVERVAPESAPLEPGDVLRVARRGAGLIQQLR
ncbi:MAG: polysaccharide biosynthesis/export family protein [Paracoccaceae bacterium]